MDSIVLESGVTLDPRFLGKDVIVFSLKVFDDLGKAYNKCQPRT